jgi:integrase
LAISCTRHPLRNAVMVLLSAKAGLRAGEIANLTWDMVVDASGKVSGVIELTDNAAKKCSGRSIPIHPDLITALTTWRQVAPPSAYVIASERGGRMRPLSRGLTGPQVGEVILRTRRTGTTPIMRADER